MKDCRKGEKWPGYIKYKSCFVTGESYFWDSEKAEDAISQLDAFAGLDFEKMLDPSTFIGRAPQQVDEFLAAEVEPIRKQYADRLGEQSELKV